MLNGSPYYFRKSLFNHVVIILLLSFLFTVANAQTKSATPTSTPAANLTNLEVREKLSKINWQKGPQVSLGNVAEMEIPEGYLFANSEDTKTLMEVMENPTSGQEVGLLTPRDFSWFVVYEFADIGYVKDDEKDKLDANQLLANIKVDTDVSNEERRSKGWPMMKIVSWEQPPQYNSQNNSLVWAVRGESEGKVVINANTRLLGRKGVMRIELVVDPDKFNTTKPILASLLEKFHFKEGDRYNQFQSGDKQASYGLTGLISGDSATNRGGILGLSAKFGRWLILIIAAILILLVLGFILLRKGLARPAK